MGAKKRDVFRLILYRFIIVTTLLIASVLIESSTSAFLPLIPFFYFIIICYILSFFYVVLYLVWEQYTFQISVQIFIDLLLITGLVYISGGLKGSFYFMYIFEIIAASLLLSKRAAYTTASLSAILFGLLVEGMFYRVIPIYSAEQGVEMSFGFVLNNLVFAWGVFFLIAFLVNSLTENLRRARKKLEQTQRELEVKKRLAIAGETSARLAHEIRNPLAAVSGSVQVLKDELTLDGKQKNLMEIILKESQRISASIDQFLNLVSPSKVPSMAIDLSTILEETLILLQQSGKLNFHYRIEGNFHSERMTFFGDVNEFKQVFWNLLNNSLKAMPEGGKLSLNFDRLKKSMIQFRIADTGKGLTREEKERIFEPFFSGFKEGKGIGMAIVRRIVDSLEGSIEISSELGKGTEIRIMFPRRISP